MNVNNIKIRAANFPIEGHNSLCMCGVDVAAHCLRKWVGQIICFAHSIRQIQLDDHDIQTTLDSIRIIAIQSTYCFTSLHFSLLTVHALINTNAMDHLHIDT